MRYSIKNLLRNSNRQTEIVRTSSCISFLIFVNLLIGLLKIKKYAPLTEGWWTVYSRWLNEGKVPYLDFNLLVPPGMPYINQFFTGVFSENFLTLRYLGLGLQTIISIYIFKLFNKVTSRVKALLISILVIQIFYSTEVVITFDYNYFAICFLIIGIFHFEKAISSDNSSRNMFHYFLMGIFLGFSSLVKLNFVFFFSIFLIFSEIFRRFTHSKSNLEGRNVFSLLGGFLSSWIPWIIYSVAAGAFTQFLRAVFLEAPSAKGSLTASLMGWIIRLPDQFNLSKNIIVYILCFFALLGIDKVWLNENGFQNRLNSLANKRKFRLVLWSLFIFASSYLSFTVVTKGNFYELTNTMSALGNLLLTISRVMPVWFVIYLWIKSIVNREYLEFLPLCLLSISLVFATGSSGGLNWYGTAVPFGLLIAFFWNKIIHENTFLLFAGIIVPVILGALLTNWALSPYNWWGLRTVESYKATNTITQGLMTGLKTDSVSLATIRIVQNDLNPAKNCQGGLFSFPSIPLFLLEAGTQPKGKDAIFWFDFVSQGNVLKATDEIKKSPPDAAVILDVPDFVWNAHSKGFNQGINYKQRELVKTLMNLEKLGYKKRVLPLFSSPGYSIITLVNKNCKREI